MDLETLAPQVGPQPTTLRLKAVRVVLDAVATRCYKLHRDRETAAEAANRKRTTLSNVTPS